MELIITTSAEELTELDNTSDFLFLNVKNWYETQQIQSVDKTVEIFYKSKIQEIEQIETPEEKVVNKINVTKAFDGYIKKDKDRKVKEYVKPVKVDIKEVSGNGQVFIRFNQKLVVPIYNKTVFGKKENDTRKLIEAGKSKQIKIGNDVDIRRDIVDLDI